MILTCDNYFLHGFAYEKSKIIMLIIIAFHSSHPLNNIFITLTLDDFSIYIYIASLKSEQEKSNEKNHN